MAARAGRCSARLVNRTPPSVSASVATVGGIRRCASFSVVASTTSISWAYGRARWCWPGGGARLSTAPDLAVAAGRYWRWVKPSVWRNAATRSLSVAGRTRWILASAVWMPATGWPRRSAASSPMTTAAASSSVSIRGGRR